MSWDKQNDSFDILKGRVEIIDTANAKGFNLIGIHSKEGEFWSNSITVNKQVQRARRLASEYDYTQKELDDSHTLGEIPGLNCPDCHAQAFKTDQKEVAVCGDYPGWYFFYRRTDYDKVPTKKLVIKNGELVEETDTEVEGTRT